MQCVADSNKKVQFGEADIWNFKATVMRQYDYASAADGRFKKIRHVTVPLPAKTTSSSNKRAQRGAFLLSKEMNTWPKKFPPSQGATSAAASSSNDSPKTWIVDSGSCFHLAGKSSLTKEERTNTRPSERPQRLNTANGTITVDEEITLATPSCNVNALGLPNSPNVLSLSFVWNAGEAPTLQYSGGEVQRLNVDRFVPTMIATSSDEEADFR